MYFIAFLRNGVLRDIRNDMYSKIVHLPIAYFSEKRKGDVIARTSADVLQVQNSFLSILELIVKEPLNIIFFFSAYDCDKPKTYHFHAPIFVLFPVF